jgi:hypothetical protein
MFKDKMINKISNNIINKINTLIGDNGQWTSKSSNNALIQKISNYYDNVGGKPLCCTHLVA